MTDFQAGDERGRWHRMLEAAAVGLAEEVPRRRRRRQWPWWIAFVVLGYVIAAELSWWWLHPEASAMELLRAAPEWIWPW